MSKTTNRKEHCKDELRWHRHHKRYSVCATQDEQGCKLGGARIEGNSAAAFAQYLAGLEGPCKVAQLRQRLYWARLPTRVRNRIHALLDRQNELALPQCSDLFRAKGRSHLRRLELPEPDGTLLQEDLALLEVLNAHIKAQEKRIAAENAQDVNTQPVQSVPGLGLILAAVIATSRGPSRAW